MIVYDIPDDEYLSRVEFDADSSPRLVHEIRRLREELAEMAEARDCAAVSLRATLLELEDVNYWRRRHCEDAEARGRQTVEQFNEIKRIQAVAEAATAYRKVFDDRCWRVPVGPELKKLFDALDKVIS